MLEPCVGELGFWKVTLTTNILGRHFNRAAPKSTTGNAFSYYQLVSTAVRQPHQAPSRALLIDKWCTVYTASFPSEREIQWKHSPVDVTAGAGAGLQPERT